jgi:hypothetical protein
MARDVDETVTDWSGHFDAKEWSRGHEKLCTERALNVNSKLNTIIGVLGWGGALVFSTLLAVAGYLYVSSQALQAQAQDAKIAALSAVHQTASEASSETVEKLGATNAAATPQD